MTVGLLSFGLPLFGPFGGNLNVAISAINVSGGIVATRASGLTPAPVIVSASLITASGTTVPFEDLDLSWNCGEPGGAEVITDPSTGNQVNLNTSQTGGLAFYTYRNAGSFVITLTARAKNGGADVIATATMTFTASAFVASGGDFFFDSVGGSDINNGTSSATPKQTLSAIQTVMSSLGSNSRLNFKRGSSWSSGSGNLLDMTSKTISGVRFNDYGSGAKPMFTTSGAGAAFASDNGGSGSGHAQSDIVISNINFQSATGYTGPAVVSLDFNGNATAAISQVWIDGCTIGQTVNAGGAAAGHACRMAGGLTSSTKILNKCGVYNTTIQNPPGVSTNTRQNLSVAAGDWFAVVGCTFSGNGTDNIFDHYIYPIVQTQALFSYNHFLGGATGKSYAVNADWNQLSGSLEFSEFWLYTNNFVEGPNIFHDASDGNNDPTLVQFRNVVTQKNAINLPGDGVGATGGTIFFNAISMTWRDNRIWGIVGPVFHPDVAANAASGTYRLYRNKVYIGATGGAFLNFNTNIQSTMGLITATDNAVQDDRATSQMLNISFAHEAGATIDRNVWYSPNDASAAFTDVSTDKTFAQWKSAGFDANGSTSNPGFVNPSAGVF